MSFLSICRNQIRHTYDHTIRNQSNSFDRCVLVCCTFSLFLLYMFLYSNIFLKYIFIAFFRALEHKKR